MRILVLSDSHGRASRLEEIREAQSTAKHVFFLGDVLKDAEYSGQDFSERMNYDSVHTFIGKAEPYLSCVEDGTSFQLLRKGYYKKSTKNGTIVLGEITSLKDSFKK